MKEDAQNGVAAPNGHAGIEADGGPGEALVPVQTVEVRPIEEPGDLIQPLRVQLAAPVVAAAGGFLVGVATFLFVRVLRRGQAPRGIRRLSPRSRSRDVVASRSFLVDVHMLRR